MKIKNVAAKILPLTLAFSLLAPFVPNVISVASAESNPQNNQSNSISGDVVFEDNTFKVTETSNVRTVLNKNNLQSTTLTYTNPQHTEGIYKDVNGNDHVYSKDAKGSVYLDGKLIVEATTTPTSSVKVPLAKSAVLSPTYYNSDHFSHNGRTYYYVTTYKYSTSTQRSISSIELDILSFLPYAGGIIGLYTLIQDVKNTGAKNLYVKEKEYCTSDYEFYAFKYYFYKYSNYTGLVDSTTVYKTMW